VEKGATLKIGIGQLILALAAGAAVAVFYFGGLWLTVRSVVTSPRPALLTFGSFIARGVITVAIMVWIAQVHWQLLLAAMAGFVLVRVIITRRLRTGDPAKELRNES
jgi:F1F0 ATPase subunit 2